MGRHGGGSSSGGGGGSGRSGGGSRSGGSSHRISSTPFMGSYNRSYYDRRGKLHRCYTSDRWFGTKSGWNFGTIFGLCFITLHMIIMVGGTFKLGFQTGGKVSGDVNRIFIEDTIDILTDGQEKKVLELFHEVYEKSGMPVTLYTADYSWKDFYSSLEVYSEELYYGIGFEEDAMIILFTVGDNADFYDWEYDMYCGDDTIKCFSDEAFDTLLENFQKGMAKQDLALALDYGWNSVMDSLGRTQIKIGNLLFVPFLLGIYSIFYVSMLKPVIKGNAAYRYFKEHPEELNPGNIRVHTKCLSCGAGNPSNDKICSYCGNSLIM